MIVTTAKPSRGMRPLPVKATKGKLPARPMLCNRDKEPNPRFGEQPEKGF